MADHLPEAQASAIARTRDAIAAGVRALGLRDVPPGLDVGRGTGGTVSLGRTLSDHLGQDRTVSTSLALDAEGHLDGRSAEALRRAIRRYARRHLRLRAIAAAALDDGPPPWSLTTHRLTAAWMRSKGMDPGGLAWLMAQPAHYRHLIGEQHGLEIDAVTMEDGRIDVRALSDRNEGSAMLIGAGRQTLHVPATLPATLVAACVGRPIAEVVDHHATRRAGRVRIVEADSDANGTTFVLEDVQDFIRRPPPGVDRRWRRVPFDPWTA